MKTFNIIKLNEENDRLNKIINEFKITDRNIILENIISDSSILTDLNNNEKLSEDDISHLLNINDCMLDDFVNLYSDNYDIFSSGKLINIIKTLSYLDSSKLQEMLFFARFFKNLDISILDDNLITQSRNIDIFKNFERWQETVKHGYIILYLKLCIIGEVNFWSNINKALCIAIMYGHFHFVVFLVENGANVKYEMSRPLLSACCNGRLQIAKYLIDKGANVKNRGHSIIGEIVSKGYLEILKLLIDDAGYIPNYIEIFNIAINSKQLPIIKYVTLESSFHISYENIHNAIYETVKFGHLDILEYLFNYSSHHFKDKNININELILKSINFNFFDITYFLLDDYRVNEEIILSASREAIKINNLNLLNFCSNKIKWKNYDILLYAIEFKNLDIITFLIQKNDIFFTKNQIDELIMKSLKNDILITFKFFFKKSSNELYDNLLKYAVEYNANDIIEFLKTAFSD